MQKQLAQCARTRRRKHLSFSTDLHFSAPRRRRAGSNTKPPHTQVHTTATKDPITRFWKDLRGNIFSYKSASACENGAIHVVTMKTSKQLVSIQLSISGTDGRCCLFQDSLGSELQSNSAHTTHCNILTNSASTNLQPATVPSPPTCTA